MTAPAYEVAIVGGGPAGLAAASWLGRHRKRTLLVDAGEPRNRWTALVHGYLGSDPVPPLELLARARRDVARYPDVELRPGRVQDVTAVEEGYRLSLPGGDVVASQLVLATGLVDELPDAEGFLDHYGVDAFHCVYCDGYETLGRRVVVLGWHPHVGEVAIQLGEWASQVTVVSQGRDFEGAVTSLRRRGIRIVQERVTALLGPRGRLTGVRMSGGETLDCELLFFYLARRPVSELARRLGCKLDGDGMVVTDEHGHTSVRGIFAAGDVTPGIQLVQVAAAEGAAAGMACARLIRARGADPTRTASGAGWGT